MEAVENSPFFTVVIPTYKRQHLLNRALQSVLEQTFQDFEVVISDDFSPQPADEVVQNIGDDRIRVIRSGKNRGNAAARNAGIRAARGKWIAFLDDDDEMFPQHLGMTHAILCDVPEEVGFSWSGVQRVQEREGGYDVLGQNLWTVSYPSCEAAYLAFLRGRRIGTGTGLVVKREAFEIVGYFDENLRAAVDTDFLIRLVRSYHFRIVPCVTIRCWDHSGPTVRSTKKWHAIAYEGIIEKHRSTLEGHPDIFALLLYKLGWQHYHAGDSQRGRAAMLRSIRTRPRWYKPWAGLILFELFGKRAPSLHKSLSRSLRN